jgi:hypothetical protein
VNQNTEAGHPPSGALTGDDDNPPFVAGIDDPEVAGLPPTGGRHSSLRVLLTRSSRARIWTAAVLLVVSSLIVVPGLVLGVVTKQLPWGIALCGLVATVISFFASFYYHLDGQD